MFSTIQEKLAQKTGIKYKILKEETIISYQEFIHLLADSHSFRSFYTDLLKQAPYEAYFWENKAMTLDSLDSPYEFVLIESPSLARVQANPSPFASKFSSGAQVVSFKNLGRDASLIVPSPVLASNEYPHLASFIHRAPEEQIHEFWKQVASTYLSDLGSTPKWLSTSGLGVYWLHVRVDSRPKYYTYAPYRQMG